MEEELTATCAECGKAITDDEWVVHWTSCAECFDNGYARAVLWPKALQGGPEL